MPAPSKFFHEVERHYDSRFFHQTLGQAAVLGTLRLLFREFSCVMLSNRVTFFIMHGTLLGWYWNRSILPWDNDLDVSVPAESLAFLADFARRFRHQRYLLEVNPAHVNRLSMNRTPDEDREQNRIDARFIDRETGLFVDITGFTDVGGGRVASKCPHVFPSDYIYPLRPSRFEGAEAFVPYNVIPLLHREYGPACTKRVLFNGYAWDRNSSSWLLAESVLPRQRRAFTSVPDSIVPAGSETGEPASAPGRPFSWGRVRYSGNVLLEGLFRRTVACWPPWKRLVPVNDETDAPLPFGRESGQLCADVLFAKLRDQETGEAFWAKKYSPQPAKQLHLELGLYEELDKLDLGAAVLPLCLDNRFGLIFPFVEELYQGTAVHLCNVRQFFSPEELRSIGHFASIVVDHPAIGRATIAELTDFQTVRTATGLAFIDFTLWPIFWPSG